MLACRIGWDTCLVRIGQANANDAAELARLIWLDHYGTSPAGPKDLDPFLHEFRDWWGANIQTHTAFVARAEDGPLVGMAWVAVLPRVPRPGMTNRMFADIQTVFVLPEHRGHGIGSALVEAATQFGLAEGALRVTVHSGRKAVPLYQRLGFESSRQLLQRPPDQH